MIINHSSKSLQELYKINDICFNSNKDLSFKLLSFIGILISPVKHAGIYELTTNMIHREVGNHSGVIGFIHVEPNASFISYEPTHIPHYKLRFPDLSSSVFTCKAIGAEKYINFSEIAFQLEVRENYGGF